MTVKELSPYIKVKMKTLYYLVKHGTIPHYRIKKLILFKKSDIDSWMESNKAKPLGVHVDKVVRSVYTSPKGKPVHLRKEV